MIEWVLRKLRIEFEDPVEVTLENNFVVRYPRAFLMLEGKAYHDALLEGISELHAVRYGNQAKTSLNLGVCRVISDHPGFIAREVGDLLARFNRI
ncbi:hypothetical protein D3C81_2016490 [compost metagenome]